MLTFIARRALYLFVIISIVMLAGCHHRRTKEKDQIEDQMTLRVNFDYNKSTISGSDTKELNEAIQFVSRYPHSRIQILGHTDNIGKPEYNRMLSHKRAEAVGNYLIKEGGINPARISVKGMGDLHPVMPNQTDDGRDNPEGRALNRRAEINIISD